MLFISISKPGKSENSEKPNVYVSLIDYSQQGIIKNKNKLYWRVKGNTKWNKIALKEDGNAHHFKASLPSNAQAETIEYYVEAESKSGKIARRPATAPEGFYEY